MENNKNKKTIILSILGVLVLVIAVVGVSFAMYTFSATGTRQNTITSGTVSLTFNKADTAVITLDDQYGKADASGIAQEPVTFNLTSALGGTMTVNYDVGFVELDTINAEGQHVDGATLTANLIKLQIFDGTNYLVGTSTTGATLQSLSANAGQTGLLESYVFDSGTINGTTGINKTYQLKAWIDESYVLKGGEAGTANVGTCSIEPATNTTAELCQTANGEWTQSKATTVEAFTFKIKVMAAQV